MGYWQAQGSQIFRGGTSPPTGSLAQHLQRHGTRVLIGHPTFRNQACIGKLIHDGILGAARHFAQEPVALVVSDGTYTQENPDESTLAAALQGARQALAALSDEQAQKILVLLAPYQGYQGDRTAGKGSALKFIFAESHQAQVPWLMLFDGDLRNDMAAWQKVFRDLVTQHGQKYPAKGFLVTAQYARHFVDASLTRFIVGPLTTLLGQYVPGGISGDIALDAHAVALQEGNWSAARRRFGTDIATTCDCLADEATVIYEVYLGAKLHDITDEAKLAVMPGEVIAAALEQLQRYEPRVRAVLEGDAPLQRPEVFPSDIGFMDPGTTNVFDIDVKRQSLLKYWQEFEPFLARIVPAEQLARLQNACQALQQVRPHDPVRFLGLDRQWWIELLGRAVGYVLATGDIDTAKQALNYLYTAAFLEFCGEKCRALGYRTWQQVREHQTCLGVPPEKAADFYHHEVDRVVAQMAQNFYEQRARILQYQKL